MEGPVIGKPITLVVFAEWTDACMWGHFLPHIFFVWGHGEAMSCDLSHDFRNQIRVSLGAYLGYLGLILTDRELHKAHEKTRLG